MINFITLSSANKNNLGLALRNELKISVYTICLTIVEFLVFIIQLVIKLQAALSYFILSSLRVNIQTVCN